MAASDAGDGRKARVSAVCGLLEARFRPGEEHLEAVGEDPALEGLQPGADEGEGNLEA